MGSQAWVSGFFCPRASKPLLVQSSDTVRRNARSALNKFIRCGDVHGPKPYKFIRSGAMDVAKPHEFLFKALRAFRRTVSEDWTRSGLEARGQNKPEFFFFV